MKWKPYHTVWLVMGFAWITNYMVRMALSPALVQIQGEFKLSFGQAGFLATAFFYAYTAIQWPAGMLGDRIGRRAIILSSSIGWTVCALLTALTTSIAGLFVVRLATGLAEGALFSNDRPVIAAVTPKDRMGLGQGLSFAGLGAGLALGLIVGGILTDNLGWRVTFALFGILSMVAVLAVWRFIPEPPRAADQGSVAVPTPGLLDVLARKDIWLLMVTGIPVIYAQWVVGTWAPTILMEVTGQSLGAASVYSAALGIAALPGLLTMGTLSDRLAKVGHGRKIMGVLGLVGVALTMGALGLGVAARLPALILGSGIFLAGLFIWGFWSPMFALYSEVVPRRVLGSVYGLVNAIAFIGSLLAPWLTGAIRDSTGSFAGGFYLSAGLALCALPILLSVPPAFRLGPEVTIGFRSQSPVLSQGDSRPK
ncbi:MAG: MFS transporter [Chloroflexi bacterium]|nr:MFS transporter [Chloroflexota bacterium]